jgi:hypothetical protein
MLGRWLLENRSITEALTCPMAKLRVPDNVNMILQQFEGFCVQAVNSLPYPLYDQPSIEPLWCTIPNK